jgi:hypothetical protein
MRNGDVDKMVNVNAITTRRELKLRREILVFDKMCGSVQINGVSFYEDEIADVVFNILNHWDFQSKLHNDESILYDLIRDSKMTYHLQDACKLMNIIGRSHLHLQAIVRTLLSLSDNVDDCNDIEVIDRMIEKLDGEKVYKDNFQYDVDARIRIPQALNPIRNYLEDLKNNMLGDEMHLRDIVKRELQADTDGVGYDVKLKIGIKKNV